VGSVAPLVIAAPDGRMPTPPVRVHLSPNDSRAAHPSSTRPSPELCPTPTSLTQTMIGSPDQPPDRPMDPNSPLVTPFLDDPESDPVVMKKGRRTAHVPSADYSTDPTTEDGAVKRRRGPRKPTRNFALEEAMDRNSEGATPSIIARKQSTSKRDHRSNEKSTKSNLRQKARSKPKRITKQPRRDDSTAGEDSNPTTEVKTVKRRTVPQKPTALEATTSTMLPVVESNLQKGRPKPRPTTKQPQREGPLSPEEQRNIEDELFIRKSTRARVEKVREAPPAQLRLEKDALKRKGRQKE